MSEVKIAVNLRGKLGHSRTRGDVMATRRGFRRSRGFGLMVLAAVTVGLAASATALAYTDSYDYFNGSLTSGEYRDRTDPCYAVTGSAAQWGTGSAWGKVVVINAGGGWLASNESDTGATVIFVSASAGGTKAYCRNSTPWQITVAYLCTEYFEHSGICV